MPAPATPSAPWYIVLIGFLIAAPIFALVAVVGLGLLRGMWQWFMGPPSGNK